MFTFAAILVKFVFYHVIFSIVIKIDPLVVDVTIIGVNAGKVVGDFYQNG
jgi:hypothetical protein